MRYNIITIEREFASGGQEIGRLLAEKLGVHCYGHEILTMAAEQKGIMPKYLEELEERPTNSFFYSIYMLSKNLKGEPMQLAGNEALAAAEGEVISQLASQGPCVIIGHCAAHFLRQRKDVLSVFIEADWEKRKERAQQVYGIAAEQTDTVLRKHDRHRSGYYNLNSGMKWNDPKNYHLVLNAGKLGIDRTVAIIEQAVQ